MDNGSKWASKARDGWAYRHEIHLDFIRRGKPVENSFNESFNRRLQAECVKVEVFFTLDEAREKLDRWRQDYNLDRPHNPLNDWALVLVAAGWSESANTTAKQGELLEALT